MATRVAMLKSRQVVAYLPGLRAAVRHFRAFSSYDAPKPEEGGAEEITIGHSTVIDEFLGPFGASSKKFPMPGMTGPSSSLKPKIQKIDFVPKPDPDVLTAQLPSDRHIDVITQAANISKQLEKEESVRDPYLPSTTGSALDLLECVATDCPDLMKKDFRELFPQHNFYTGRLTVITLSQRTDNDMSLWSTEVDGEREELLENFVKGATEICDSLFEAGYWADFIDPSSGKPYRGAHTNATMFETDERYRSFGFEIDDLGCCKVIRHHLWGTRAYVGCLFTSAPIEHPVILDLTLASMLREEDHDG